MDLIKLLDLDNFINEFYSFLARTKPLFIEGDINLHFKFINELKKYEFKAPNRVKNLDSEIIHIQKQGILRLEDIYEFVKIFRYFLYLKRLNFEGNLKKWLDEIDFPQDILEIVKYFDEKGNLLSSIDDRLLSLESSLKETKESIKHKLQGLLNSNKLQGYLVDRQIHYINEEEALLVRGGFNHVLKGTIVGRSSSGFFYVVPEALRKVKEKEAAILSQIEEVKLEWAKKISNIFLKWIKFIKYINKQFDRFDHYQARVNFSKSKNLFFILPKSDDKIVLKDFIHPAIHNPKPINVDFSKKILIITGVNAGGKTMLLKSILSAAFLSKYLIPMKLDAQKSHIGRFKEIIPIIEDPQNVKNDISTFAGRMLSFSHLFQKRDVLVGVDEIELGTDSDEAASLFKVILEDLLKRGIKVAITTHHKRLAALMANYDEVELVAAIYDEEKGAPTYEFLQGIIGKSYAFETAKRYGIPLYIVKKAIKEYGEDQAKLSELIERGSELERELRAKNEKLNKELERVEFLRKALEEERHSLFGELKMEKEKLSKIFQEAINEAKAAIKAKEVKEAHRLLTKAHKIAKEAKIKEKKVTEKINVGDSVKYRKNRGVVISLKDKEAYVDFEGIKMRVPLNELKKVTPIKKKKEAPKIKVSKPSKLSVKLDLHGLRVDEALEKVDKFISDSLIAGFDEVLIYHGVGSGKLASAVREFLKKHPKVKSFHDAPPNMGGFGATVVEL
ncbi:endonuclease MutS2 [Nitrosophilus kaiyonis]|uniref:endonuclease MutS2 n=1 Tax=Nitrosophilus kaiyonis TaxID=2930200 RepID=UPI00248FAE5A|nr:endonuclease MutS2 [Nitrosophilus kaiyonis]